MTYERRDEDWKQTATGRAVWPLDLRPEDVALADIAHALSNVCRYGGHCPEFYSVAQHSVLVSLRAEALADDALPVDPGEFDASQLQYVTLCARWGLLHDAAKAYLGDVIRPLKRTDALAGYRDAERRAMGAITQRFGMCEEEPREVQLADHDLLTTEARDLFPVRPRAWGLRGVELPERIVPLSPLAARALFYERFLELWERVP